MGQKKMEKQTRRREAAGESHFMSNERKLHKKGITINADAKTSTYSTQEREQYNYVNEIGIGERKNPTTVA